MLSPEEGSADEHAFEEVSECGDLLEAEMVRGLLESRGIAAKVVSRDQWVGKTAILGVRGLTSVHVAVPAGEVAHAREVLLEAESGALGLEGDRDDPAECCPKCGSAQIQRENISGLFVAGLGLCSLLMIYLLIQALSIFNVILFVVFLVFAARMLLGGDVWRCGGCRHTWKD